MVVSVFYIKKNKNTSFPEFFLSQILGAVSITSRQVHRVDSLNILFTTPVRGLVWVRRHGTVKREGKR